MNLLRKYIRLVLEGKHRSSDSSDADLLVEPDESKDTDEVADESALNAIKTVLTIASMAKSLSAGEEKEAGLIIEPDLTDEDDEVEQEASAGGVAGVSTPMGTNSTYPDRANKRKKAKKN